MADAPAAMHASERGGRKVLAFTGRLDAQGAAVLWTPTMRAAHAARGRDGLLVDLGQVTGVDMAGAAFLLEIEKTQGSALSLEGGNAQVAGVLERARQAVGTPRASVPPEPPTLEEVLQAGWQAMRGGIAFLGEAVIALIRLPARRRMLRTDDLLRYADQAGVRSVPLLLLLGFLIGVILAFQSAVPMRRFGADLYVANLVSISLLRELGPLLASVILAGRTGSAFAAEIGTMKVNEEVDALVTMRLDPMTMLVLPRLVAVVLVMPAMTLTLDIAGLAGMTVVMMAFGFPPVTVANQVASAATVTDLLEGLAKAIFFGAVIAAIGCRQGLSTGVGPRAVGLAATGAVVGGIVATVLLDGLFAILLYRLKL